MKYVLALLLLFCAVNASAQMLPVEDRTHADWASTAAVAGTIGADVFINVYANRAHPWKAVGCEALKFGLVNVASIGMKKLLPRERPDGSDNQDSFSEHTANAFAATGWSAGVSVPIATFVGAMRIGSGRHDKTGVSEGTALGTGVRTFISHLTFCKGVS